MLTWLEQFAGDVRYGVRGLARTPGFTLLAVLSLGLGIMAVTAIYSVLYAVVLDPFPYKDVDNLTSVRVSNPVQRGGRTGYSTDQFLEIAERSMVFEGVIASTISGRRSIPGSNRSTIGRRESLTCASASTPAQPASPSRWDRADGSTRARRGG